MLKPGGLWEWRWRQPHPCGGCSALITKGEIEVEIITRGGVALILHRRCLELWEQKPERLPPRPRARSRSGGETWPDSSGSLTPPSTLREDGLVTPASRA